MRAGATFPIVLRIDSSTAVHHVPAIVAAFDAAFGRAVARALAVLPASGEGRAPLLEPPAFRWSGAGLAAVTAAARGDLEAALSSVIRERTARFRTPNAAAPPPAATRSSGAGRMQPAESDDPQRARTARFEREIAARPRAERPLGDARPRAAAAAFGEPGPGGEWGAWLSAVEQAVQRGADVAHATESADAPLTRLAAAERGACAERIERALAFVSEAARIVRDGLTNTAAERFGALGRMVNQLDRGFVLAFVQALGAREFRDTTVEAVVVPLADILREALLRADDRAVPFTPRQVVAIAARAFPFGDQRFILGEAVPIDYDALVERHAGLRRFRDALVDAGLEPELAHAFGGDFTHAVLSALIDEYRDCMNALVGEIVTLQLGFEQRRVTSPADLALLARRIDAVAAELDGRTPQVALHRGEELRILRERLLRELHASPVTEAAWRATVEPIAGGFAFVLVAPAEDELNRAHASSAAGRDELRAMLRGYAALAQSWHAIGVRRIVWRTHVGWLDVLVGYAIAELKANGEPGSALFDPPGYDDDA